MDERGGKLEWLQLTRATTYGEVLRVDFWCHTSLLSVAPRIQAFHPKWILERYPKGFTTYSWWSSFQTDFLFWGVPMHTPLPRSSEVALCQQWEVDVSGITCHLHLTYTVNPHWGTLLKGTKTKVSHTAGNETSHLSKPCLCVCLKSVWEFSPIEIAKPHCTELTPSCIPAIHFPTGGSFFRQMFRIPLSNTSCGKMDKCLGFWMQLTWKINRRH